MQDRDYVVVGATPEEMVKRGFKPGGRGFPGVPASRDARGIRARAHRAQDRARATSGFVFHADAESRSRTTCSGATSPSTRWRAARTASSSIPTAASATCARGVLRHVSDAFAEDPVRILRVARFAARFGFAVAPETLALMRAMVAAGEADALVPERVWQELARGLMEATPSRMFAVLRECGALARDPARARPVLRSPRRARARSRAASTMPRRRGFVLPVRFALLVLDLRGRGRREASPRA